MLNDFTGEPFYTDGLKNGGGLSAFYGSVKSTARNFVSSGLLTVFEESGFPIKEII